MIEPNYKTKLYQDILDALRERWANITSLENVRMMNQRDEDHFLSGAWTWVSWWSKTKLIPTGRECSISENAIMFPSLPQSNNPF